MFLVLMFLVMILVNINLYEVILKTNVIVLLCVDEIPGLSRFGYKNGIFMTHINDKEKFYNEHFPYFAISWHKFGYDKISKYGYAINDPEPEFQRIPKLENKIWVLWLQGEENAPDVVKASINSIRKHANGMEVIVLDRHTARKYTHLPDYIWKKYEEKKMQGAHLSDLIRLDLIYRYGGMWIDATVLLDDKLPEEISKCDLFMFKAHKVRWWYPPSKGLYTCEPWFISALLPNNRIIRLTLNVLLEYWKYENSQYVYLLVFPAITFVIKNDSLCFDMYNKMPEYRVKYWFWNALHHAYTEERYKYFSNLPLNGVKILKMTYKVMRGHPPKGSIADYICRKYDVKCNHNDGYK